jgi:phosphatidylglycerol:prolipoprotein diacylglycerol transferase
MIPYLYFPVVSLGFFTIHTWGFFVAIGAAAALVVARHWTRRLSLDAAVLLNLSAILLMGGFIGARLFHVFFYAWPYYRLHPEEIVAIWQGGLSSFGGFIGAALVAWLYLRHRKLPLLPYADLTLSVLPLGMGIGRVGCFINNHHPGQRSSSWLAVAFPDGPRLDMGLIEAVFLFTLFGVLTLLARRSRPPGFYVSFVAIAYGVVRFSLDFYRAADIPLADVRYFQLTPAQYGSIALLFLGMFTAYMASRQNSRRVVAYHGYA